MRALWKKFLFRGKKPRQLLSKVKFEYQDFQQTELFKEESFRSENFGFLGNFIKHKESNFRNAKLIEKANKYRRIFWNNNDITRKYGYIPGVVFIYIFFCLKEQEEKGKRSFRNNFKRVKYLWLIFKHYVSNSNSFVWFTLKQNFSSNALVHSKCFNVFFEWLASTFNLLPSVAIVTKTIYIFKREPVTFQVYDRRVKILHWGELSGVVPVIEEACALSIGPHQVFPCLGKALLMERKLRDCCI